MKRDCAAAGILAALLVLVFFPALFQGRTLLPTDMFDTMILPYSQHFAPPTAYNHNLTDAIMQSYPWKVFAQQALRSGHLAYWNPYIMGGYAQYAASRQAFDVFNLLLIPFDLPFAFNLIIILQLWVAGIGMYVLLRSHSLRRSVATMFATAWMFNGMFLTHLTNLWATSTFCWVPFALAMCYRYYRGGRHIHLLSAACFIALAFLGSTLQSAMYVVVVLASVTFFYSRSSNRNSALAWLGSLAIAIIVAIGLSAIFWIPSIEMFFQVIRHGSLFSPTHDFVYTISKRAISFAMLLFFYIPELMGVVRSFGLPSIANLHPLDYSGYFGFTEMLLATWALFSLRSTPREYHGYALLIVLGIGLPIFTPLFPWLYHRFFIVATLGGCVLGAQRLNALLDRQFDWNRLRPWVRGAAIGVGGIFCAIVLTNIALALAPSYKTKLADKLFNLAKDRPFSSGNLAWVHSRVNATFDQYWVFSPTVYVPMLRVLLCLFVLRAFVKDKSIGERRTVLLLWAAAMIQIFFWWRAWQPMLDQQKYPLLPVTPGIQYLQQHAIGSRIYVDRRNVDSEQYVFLDNEPAMYGLSEIQGYESQVARSFYPVLKNNISPQFPHSNFLGQLAIEYVVAGKTPFDTTHLRRVAEDGIVIYHNDLALPRARLLYSSAIMPDDSAIVHNMLSTTSDDSVLYFTSGESGPELGATTKSWSSIDRLSATDNHVVIEASPAQNAYLLLTDAYYPGWKCTVDGNPATIHRANMAMRAVFLSAGKHRVEFQFNPESYSIGKWVSLFSIALAAIGFIFYRKKPEQIQH